jgi:DNA modification methylase
MRQDWDTFNEVVEPKGSYSSVKGFKKLPRNKLTGVYEFFLPTWRETLRVLKPGGFAFVMCSPRQDLLTTQIRALTDAGFDTAFSSIYWTYATGFPKGVT